MSDRLLSVGLDVGTSTTQLVLSRLTVKNLAGSFAVPEMEITEREIVYRSPVHFTPLLEESRVDGQAIRQLVSQEYEKAGISRQDVDTGAIIITGETSRKENAQAVLQALSGFAGDFVAATAGPDLESVLAAKGAGATEYSLRTGKRVLHMDIGGGTSNLALIENGQIIQTGCLNVGGRLLKRAQDEKVYYLSPVVRELTDIQLGQIPPEKQIEELAEKLAAGLEMAAGLRPKTELFDKLLTREVGQPWKIPEGELTISFSGGVADCIETTHTQEQFGDMGGALGAAIRKSLLCRGQYMLGKETIRATVIGAGSHSARLSGSTVFYRSVELPLKNLPVAVFSLKEQDAPELPQLIRQRMQQADAPLVMLSMPGYAQVSYAQVQTLADRILQGVDGKNILICLEADMAKALGQQLCLKTGGNTPCLCIDRVRLAPESYLDVGKPVGPALPVVIKTLVLETPIERRSL